MERVPLTLQDVLYPQEGDYIVQTDAHDDDCAYLKAGLKNRFRDDPTVVVLSDCRVDFNVTGVEPLVPDVAVIFGVRKRRNWATFRVAEDQARIALLLEVTSPTTRVNDVVAKFREYYRARVPWYIIVDADDDKEPRTLQLLGYRYTAAGYERMVPNERGWLWLEPVQLWLGVEGSVVVLYDDKGTKIGDYTEVAKAREAAEAQATEERNKAQAEAQARATAEAEATEERNKAQAEVQARAAAEAQATEERNKAQAEAQARAAAEDRAVGEAEQRKTIESRLKELEAELQRLRGYGQAPNLGKKQ
jgi:Uma2 family endonuclease